MGTPSRRGDDGLPADRLVYFSDAVVAIAITLLVLPLVDLVPDARDHREPVASLVAHNTGPIIAFLLGFAVIARLWSSHHDVFDGVERVGRVVVLVDMVWLLTIVVLPFPTALTGVTAGDPATVRLYVGVLAVNMLAMTALAALVHRRADDPGRHAASVRGVGSSAVLIIVAFVLVLIRPALGFWVLILLFASPLVERILVVVGRRRAAG